MSIATIASTTDLRTARLGKAHRRSLLTTPAEAPAKARKRPPGKRHPGPGELSLMQVAWLEGFEKDEATGGKKVIARYMAPTPGGRLALFGDRAEFAALADARLIYFVAVEGLAWGDGTPCCGVIRLTPEGREALETGRFPTDR
jgi:hypothetical protein